MIIDWHTHFVPPAFAHDRRQASHLPRLRLEGDLGVLYVGGQQVRTIPRPGFDADARVRYLDQVGVDIHALSPIPPLIPVRGPLDVAAESARILNDGIAAAVARHPARLAGLAGLPMHHPRTAIELAERATAAGLVGVEITGQVDGGPLDAAGLADVYDALADLGLILYVHPLLLGGRILWTDRFGAGAVGFGLAMPTDTAAAAADLVLGGVLARRPGLRLCLAHGGGTFLWALPRIRKYLELNRGHQATAELDEVMRRVYVDSIVYDRANLRYLVDTVGADRILWGTDYPLPAREDASPDVLIGLTDQQRSAISARNALGLLPGRWR